MPTITKRTLQIDIADETGLTQQQVLGVIQCFIEKVTDSLAAGDQVVLRNFGTFQVRVAKQKVGRNPNNPGENVIIPPRAIVKFKPGKEMKEKVAMLLPELVNQD